MKTKPPRVIESSDLDEIVRTVRDHDLASADIGEWTGTIEGEPVIIRLVRPSDVVLSRLKGAIGAAFTRAEKKPKRTGKQASIGETILRLRANANASRWF